MMDENEYNQLVDFYEGRLVNPEHFPLTFNYQVRLFKFEQSKQTTPFMKETNGTENQKT